MAVNSFITLAPGVHVEKTFFSLSLMKHQNKLKCFFSGKAWFELAQKRVTFRMIIKDEKIFVRDKRTSLFFHKVSEEEISL